MWTEESGVGDNDEDDGHVTNLCVLFLDTINYFR